MRKNGIIPSCMNKRYITPPTSIEIYFIISLRNEIIRFHVMTLNVLAIVLLLQNTYTTYWYEERYPDGKSISRVSAPRNSSCRTRNDIHGRRPEEVEQHRIEDIVYVFREICIHKLDVPWIDALGAAEILFRQFKTHRLYCKYWQFNNAAHFDPILSCFHYSLH